MEFPTDEKNGDTKNNNEDISLSNLVFEPSLLNISDTDVLTQRTFQINLKNNGENSELISTNLSDSSNFSIIQNFCDGNILPADDSCLIELEFSPISNGLKETVLVSNDSKSIAVAQISGTGINQPSGLPPANLIFNIPSYDFELTQINSTKSYELTLSNIGGTSSSPLSISYSDALSPISAPIGFNYCEGNSLNSGSSCTILVEFTPQSVNNLQQIITIGDGTYSAQITIDGEGVNFPVNLSSSLVFHDFQNVNIGDSLSQSVTLTNIGESDSNSLSLNFNLPNHFSIINDNCSGNIISPTGTCTIDIVFAPESATNITRILSVENLDISLVGQGINPASSFPISFSQNISINEDSSYSGNLNAYDPNNLTISFSNTNTTNGALVVDTNSGNFTYTPNANFHGADSFTFFVTNSNSEDSNISTIDLIINSVNDIPTAIDDYYTVNEDSINNIFYVTDNDSDVDGDLLRVVGSSGALHGIANIGVDDFGLPTQKYFIRYTPNANFNGQDRIIYTISDGNGGLNKAVVYITVDPINDAPTTNNMSFSIDKNESINNFLNGQDIESVPLTFIIEASPTNGSLNLINSSTGEFEYIPNNNYVGTDSFSYKVNDGSLDSNISIIDITINATNTAPTTENILASTDEDVAVGIALLGNDLDSDILTYEITTSPTYGTLSGVAPNLTYTPNLGYSGIDFFTYRVNDGTVNSNISSIIINIDHVNKTPTSNNLSFNVDKNSSESFSLISTDLDSDPLTYEIVIGPSNGVLTGVAPNLTYTPTLEYVGGDSFTYRANDGTAYSNIATVTITVIQPNRAPTSTNESFTINSEVLLSDSLIFNDLDGDSVTFILVQDVLNGSLNFNIDGTFTYTSNPSFIGDDSFIFKVNDGQSDSILYSAVITVTAPPNLIPIADDINISLDKNTTSPITLSGNDPESEPISFILVTLPSNGYLTGTTPNLTYTPNNDYTGADSFTYKINDGENDSTIATVSITINPTFCDLNGMTIPFAGGSGTALEPYQICSPSQFNQIATDSDYLNKYFILENDIDFTGEELSRIGGTNCSSSSFVGNFNGNNYSIRNVTIIKPTEDKNGIFRCFNGTIYDTNFEFITLSGRQDTGIFGQIGVDDTRATIGSLNNLELTNIVVTGTYKIGVLNGIMYDSDVSNITIANSSVSLNVSPSGQSDAGLISGFCNKNSNISNLNLEGSVFGDIQVGGIVGQLGPYCTINQGVINVSVSGSVNVGGVISVINEGGEVKNISAIVDVSASSLRAGGIVSQTWYCGSSWNSSIIEDNFIEGNVSAAGIAGGAIGILDSGADCNIRKNGVNVSVSTTSHVVGGFVGRMNAGNLLENNYSWGVVYGGGNNIGGFIGQWSDSNINYSYATGEVSGVGTIGGFSGQYTAGTCTGCLFSDSTTQATSADPDSHLETDANMRVSGTYTAEGYDFTTIWTMGLTYPIFQ